MRTYNAQPDCPDRHRAPIPGGIVIKTRRAVASGITALVTMAALAACGDAPDSSSPDAGGTSGGGETTAATSDYLPCIDSDACGFDDHSFNQLSYEGVKQAAD